MHFATTTALATLAATSALAAPLNSTREFLLKTELEPNQADKCEFENLYLSSYHTGAGLNDAVFVNSTTDFTPKAFLANTTTTGLSELLLDLGNTFPYGLVPAYGATYAGWLTVQINAGDSPQNFFFNKKGLQYTTAPTDSNPAANEFNGWLVCNWWHGVPQLFWQIADPGVYTIPSSCARINLIPEYI